MNRKYYTGVGSRNTPPGILKLMEDIARHLQREGYTLRSGGAGGADTAFETGAGLDKEIFYAKDATPAAMEMAGRFHPAWNALRRDGTPVVSDYAKKLHGRNSFQVLGRNLQIPSRFLICWTQDGCKRHVDRTQDTGGTGTAISIADANNVHVYNLATKGDRHYWEAVVYQPQTKEEPMHKLKYIYTAHYRWPAKDRTDITVKGQDPIGRYFAPSWDMVKGVKDGTMTEQEYIDRYLQILKNVPTKAWDWLLSEETRTFVCFCNKEEFCHRNILLNYLLQIFGDRIQYCGWKDV